MKIAVGTTNEAKMRSVRIALDKLGFAYTLEGVKVDSKVNAQPLSEDETIKGAITRAKETSKEIKGTEYTIGIESGIQKINQKYFECGWICVIQTFDEKIGLASSNRYEVSNVLMEKINSGLELSAAIEGILGLENVGSSTGMSGIITNGLINRDDSYVDAIILAFAPFVSNKKLWD
jgi:inosine/xanthosine triphosphatase